MSIWLFSHILLSFLGNFFNLTSVIPHSNFIPVHSKRGLVVAAMYCKYCVYEIGGLCDEGPTSLFFVRRVAMCYFTEST